MKILCLIHADFETPGVIGEWAHQRSDLFTLCCPYRGEDCLIHPDFDMLLIMGGPQSATELEEYPYLHDEIMLIQQAVQDNKRILGFCLGAQLIGAALGATPAKSHYKEVGVYPITLTDSAPQDPLLQGLPQVLPVIHWHGEMPGLTKDAVILAHSDGCPRQIVRYAPHIYGFQCHLEITHEGMKEMIHHCPGDLAPGRFIQSEAELLAQDYDAINTFMLQMLDRFITI